MAQGIILGGSSALDYWRAASGAAQVGPGHLARARLRPPRARDATYARLCELAADLQIPVPLRLVSSTAFGRRNSRLASCFVWADDGIQDDVEWVCPNFGVCRVPLALAQIAATDSPVVALLAVLEFCGTYLMAPATDAGFINAKQSKTTASGLAAWLEARSPGLPAAAGRMKEVLRFAQDGSNSPAESKVYSFMTLDRSRGGLGIEGLELNRTLELGSVARGILGYERMRPDFYLPAAGVAGEYKSRRFHPEDTWTNDDRRMDALAAEGLTTFSLNNERTRSLKELSAVGLMVAKRLNLRRHAPTPEQLKARRALHTMLFSTREFDGDEPPEEAYAEATAAA